MIKKPSKKNIIFACILLTAMFALVTWMTQQGPNASAPSASASTSVETPAQPDKEPVNTTPALIGGVAAIAVYYVCSMAIDAVKKKKRAKKENSANGNAPDCKQK